MNKLVLTLLVCVAASLGQSTAVAQRPAERLLRHDMQNKGDVWAQRYAQNRPWHGNHYYQQYGQPTAVVVPPNAVMQQTQSWGVSRNYMQPIYHQYGYQGMPAAGGPFYATPIWPSSTQQFGVYPVRAPW